MRSARVRVWVWPLAPLGNRHRRRAILGAARNVGAAVGERVGSSAAVTTCGTPLRSGHVALCHELVNVVVVAVLDARADASGPHGPQAVADPALAEGGPARGRPVRGMAGVECVREVVVLHLDRIATGGYPREHVPMLTDGGEGGVNLDPAQHVRYTDGP
jgi:hypothetical protein